MPLLENPLYFCIAAGLVALFGVYYAVSCRVRLLRKSAEYNNIYNKYSELQLKYAVTESKFTDVIAGAAKAESEKMALQETAARLERDLNVQKASAAAREE